ncbi:MAG: alkaline phosphatase D family protein [Cyanobacteriota bacterium]|nr:alkaline phosphatase D family protein [Cyanobacteriota bacterium]
MATIVGDPNDNILNGTPEADEIFGLEGNDLLNGLQGNDTLNGNEGNDSIIGGENDDLVRGGRGDDNLVGDRGNDVLYGDTGFDTLIGGEGQDIFVIRENFTAGISFTDTVLDFVDNQDLIGLEEINFSDLEVVADESNNTIIQNNLNTERLILLGVEPSQITEVDFTNTLSPFPGSAFINGLASGDTTQTSTVLWTRSLTLGSIRFETATDPNFNNIIATSTVNVTDTNSPVKTELTQLTPGTEYYYRVISATGEQRTGEFQTPNELGTREGLRFGVSGDLQGALAPFVSLKNADERDLEFFVQMGDMMEADSESAALPGVTQAQNLSEFRIKQSEIYSPRFGLNTWVDLRATTSVYGTWDDHEITNDFAGGATPADSPQRDDIFGDAETGFVNDTPVFEEALQAFQDYFPLQDEFYGETGDPRTANEQKLYRYNTFGSDAASFVLDVRSFRDAPLPFVSESATPDEIIQQFVDAFEPGKTMLGEAQLEQFKADLLEAQNDGITWKFIFSTVPMQNFGIPTIGERWEGFAEERAELLNFIEDNNIENVVFVTGDFHGNVVNNVTNQQFPGGPITPTNVFDIMVGPVGIQLTVPFLPEPFNETFAAPFGPATVGFTPEGLLAEQGKSQAEYLALSDRAEQDQFVREVLDYRTETLFGYDPIGLEGSPINANLLQGEYIAAHTYGWTEFEIASETAQLTVTTYGVPPYTEADLLANPDPILAAEPFIVSQFEVTPL